MKKRTGNLVTLAKQNEFDVIIHGCNCFCTMGKGIAKQIKEAFPAAYELDCLTRKGDIDKLGQIVVANIAEYHNLCVVNAYTQYKYGNDRRHCSYEAIEAAFRKIKFLFPTERIGYPRIGCSNAGGDWDIVSKIIDKQLEGLDHTLVIWPV